MHDKAQDKELPYQESVKIMGGRLRELGFNIEVVSWLNPLPAAWSVHIREKSFPELYTNGKGSSRDAAMASALGEFFERLGCFYFFSDYYLGYGLSEDDFLFSPNELWFSIWEDELPDGLLTEELWRFYNPDNELLPSHLLDFNSGGARGICSLPFKRVRDGREVFFPVNLLDNLYASNGMASGNTPPEARVQALSEIIERHVKTRIIAGGICLPEVPPGIIDKIPGITESIDRLRAEGFMIMVRDASLGGRFPVINITLVNRDNGGVFAAFGCHPIFEIALERTLTELVQGRKLSGMDDFEQPVFDIEEVAGPGNIERHFVDSAGLVHWNFLAGVPDYDFMHWGFTGSRSQEERYLMDLICRFGREIYIADYTHLGIYCCRILVPGFSEIYPVDDLILENKNMPAGIRDDIIGIKELDNYSIGKLYNRIVEEGYPPEQSVFELIGLVPCRGHFAGEMELGELNAMMALAAGMTDDAAMWCSWCANESKMKEPRRKVYRCLEIMLNIEGFIERDRSEFNDVLNGIYGPELMSLCRKIIRGDERFYGMGNFPEVMNGRLKEILKKCRGPMKVAGV